MASSKFLLALFLSIAISSAIGERGPLKLSAVQQCRLQRLRAVEPTRQIESEGGRTELWDENQDQFQCAGVVAMRNNIRPNGLSLPNYHPLPRLVYIEQGQGYISITFPGCAETYEAYKVQRSRESEESWERKQKGSVRDLHQKVHRIRRGDIIAIPAGAAHWCYNDGHEELVAVSINDLNHQSNQLDQKFRAFYLAGGVPKSAQGEQNPFQNIIRAFDSQLLAEAYNVPEEIVKKMQGVEEERGLSIIVRERMSFIRPEEEQEQEQEQEQGNGQSSDNGLEETYCSMKFKTNIENRRKADIYSREAGNVIVADKYKLPILQYIDLSAEKGTLYPNALISPNWAMNGHTIVYVTRGDAQVEIVNHSGRTMMNDRVNKGHMFVIPQYYTSTARAGNNGFEWVAFKTTGSPMRSPLAGYTSVIRAMPLQVLTNAYQISPKQAQGLKVNRGGQSFLLSSSKRRQY
ncbi:hypothetical protein ACJIZ3_011845 [Penstemon smallii]|uniref:Cupin type-1 domain-containing protein n=1 Tax=Penstemon smallii TaxID=265156 RepID=A0ABD3UPN5_9LAMI